MVDSRLLIESEEGISPGSSLCANQNNWSCSGIRFPHAGGVHTESSSSRNYGSKCRLKVRCTMEPFSRSKALIRSIFPVWKEGLLLIRFSVFFAVISGVCLLVWYGQVKSKKFIETSLLPSVCSVLSEYIERGIDLGKVQRVSPLSITMDTCSIGPHREEFSCGEVPTMKLCLRPFASLRRGKIVIDAILTRRSVLIVQKEDFSWLGIPYSEGTLKRHCSSEEGIDYRTKTRRMAREESIALWLEKRDEDARKAAEMGYIVPEEGSTLFEANALKEVASHSTGLASSDTFFCADERMHWRDHHCVDTGVGYDLKHADLEKSFGVKIPETGVRFWSRLIPGPVRRRFKRKAQRRDIAVAFAAAKRRILERSAEAAVAYFRGQENAESTDLSQPAAGMDANQLETLLPKSDRPTGTQTSGVAKYHQNGKLDNQNKLFNKNPEKKVDYRTSEPAVDCSTSNKIKELKNYMKNDIENGHDSRNKHPSRDKCSGQNDSFSFIRKPFLVSVGKVSQAGKTSEQLTCKTGVSETENAITCNMSNDNSEGASVDGHFETSLKDKMVQSIRDTSHVSPSIKFEPLLAMNHSIPILLSEFDYELRLLHVIASH